MQQHHDRATGVSARFEERDLLAMQDDLPLSDCGRPRPGGARRRRLQWTSAAQVDEARIDGHGSLPRRRDAASGLMASTWVKARGQETCRDGAIAALMFVPRRQDRHASPPSHRGDAPETVIVKPV